MDLHWLASALLTVWFVVMPPAERPAGALASEIGTLATPKSARFNIFGSVNVDDISYTLNGKGEFAEPDSSRLQLETEPGMVEVVAIGKHGYVRLTPFDQPPGSTEWQQFDPDRDLPTGLPMGDNGLPTDVAESIVSALGDQQLVGTESLAGGLTNHYRLSVDLRSLAQAIVGPELIGEGDDSLDGIAIQLDYWIGLENRYLQQFKGVLDAPARPHVGGRDTSVYARFEMSLFDFDQPIAIEPPIGRQPRPTPSPTPAPAPVQAPRPAPVQVPARSSGR